MPRKVLNIAELLDANAGEMTDSQGAVHAVKQLSFAAHHAIRSADGSPDSFDILKAEVRKVVPTLSADELEKYGPETANAILTLAGAGIEAVEKLFPNAVRLEG